MGFRPVPCPGVSTGISAAAPGALLCLWFLYRSRSSFSAPVSRAQVFWLTSLAPFFRPLRVGHRQFFRAVRLGRLALPSECLRFILLGVSLSGLRGSRVMQAGFPSGCVPRGPFRGFSEACFSVFKDHELALRGASGWRVVHVFSPFDLPLL